MYARWDRSIEFWEDAWKHTTDPEQKAGLQQLLSRLYYGGHIPIWVLAELKEKGLQWQ